MAGIGDLIGVFLQGGMTGSGATRVNHSISSAGIGGLLEQALGGGGSSALGGLLGAARGALGNTGKAVQQDPLATGGLGALAGALLGGGGSSAKGAMGGGALAMLAGLAFKALSNTSKGGVETNKLPLGLRAPTDPGEEQELEHSAQLVLKAMVNAVKADGEIDATEMQRLVGKLRDSDADEELRQWVETELRKPLDVDGLASQIPNQQVAAQVYAASLFAIEVDTQAERDYLKRLASRIDLNPQVVQALHAGVGVV